MPLKWPLDIREQVMSHHVDIKHKRVLSMKSIFMIPKNAGSFCFPKLQAQKKYPITPYC